MRPDVDTYFVRMAHLAASRGTCARRKVGCVLVNKRNHVLATGYNGPAMGVPHCIDTPCPGADAPSGTALDACQAIHAEANALLQCKDVWDIETVYCTASPCIHCIKLLMNTGARKIVYSTDYPHGEVAELWKNSRMDRFMYAVPGAFDGA